MEPYPNVENIKKLCRTCFKEEANMKNILETNITLENNSTAIIELLNVLTTVELNEKYPNHICICCIDKLTQIYEFRLQCENTNYLLLNYIKIKKEDSITIKEDPYAENSPNNLEDIDDVKLEDKVSARTALKKHCCTVCQEYFKTKKLLLIHRKNHKLLKCLLCDEKFSLAKELQMHEKIKHSESIDNNENIDDISEEISNLSCSTCRKTFKSKYTLLVHEKRHALKGHFLCTTCGKGFNARGCLNRHMRVHTGERKYECNVCKKKFPSSNNLNLHFRIHSGEKPYLCTVCGKSFSHPTGLTYHLRTHTKERKYKCNFCSKAFAVQCHLDNHRKIHTGERPHACKQCDKAFIKKVDLQRHELTHTGVKPFVCTVCDKDFLRPLHLNYHMMIHTSERPHKCSHCGKGFIRRYYLKDHMLKHHGIKETKTETDDMESEMKVENLETTI